MALTKTPHAAETLVGPFSSWGGTEGVDVITPTADALQLCVVGSQRTGGGTPVIPTMSGCGLTWVQAGTRTLGTARRETLFRALGASPSAESPTFDFGGESQDRIAYNFCEWGGVDTGGTNGSAAVRQVVTNAGGPSTNPNVDLAAFGAAENGTYAAYLAGTNSGGATAGTGFDLLGTLVGGTNIGLAAEGRLDNDTNANFTTGSVSWSIIGAEIVAAVPNETLTFSTQPANTQEDTVMANIVVESSDTGSTAEVTLTIGDNPGSGTLGGDTVKNMVAGSVTFNDIEINNPASGYTLLANATGHDEVESASFNITLEPADHLAWNSQPIDTQVDAIITPAMTVRALNSEGAVDTSQTGNVTIARQAGTGTLGGTLVKAMVAGVATFDDVTYDTAEEDVQLRATHASLTLADSALFDVTASPPPSARRGFGIRLGSPLTMRL